MHLTAGGGNIRPPNCSATHGGLRTRASRRIPDVEVWTMSFFAGSLARPGREILMDVSAPAPPAIRARTGSPACRGHQPTIAAAGQLPRLPHDKASGERRPTISHSPGADPAAGRRTRFGLREHSTAPRCVLRTSGGGACGSGQRQNLRQQITPKMPWHRADAATTSLWTQMRGAPPTSPGKLPVAVPPYPAGLARLLGNMTNSSVRRQLLVGMTGFSQRSESISFFGGRFFLRAARAAAQHSTR